MTRLDVSKEITIQASAEEIFPLICPVKEYDWIPNWKCKLIFCPNGKNEKDVVFKEKISAPFIINAFFAETTWTTILHDSSNYKVHFKWENKISTSIYKIELHSTDSEQTICKASLNYNILDDKKVGNARMKLESKIEFLIEGLLGMLKHYCETGEQMNTNGNQRKTTFIKSLTASEKLIFLINKVAMKLTFDPNRISYLKAGIVKDFSKTN